MAVDPSGETVAEDDESRPVALAPGDRLGKYRLLRTLGRGGMGVVWAAHDPDLDREVALKLLHRGGDEAARARLQREARAMAKLKHPNVLVVHEVVSAGGRDFIAMELVDGDSLDAWLARKPPRREIVAALLAAGRGLAAAHAVGLVHRDFKPHNVLRSRDGRVLVTDFGLARGPSDDEIRASPVSRGAALEETVEATPSSGKLTQTGALVGTPAYMSPEQFSGAPPDPRTDQFAFCVTAWQALAGARPFSGASIDELADAVARGVADLDAALPRRVRAVLARGLDPDPARRWPSIDDLLAALERATSSRKRLAIVAAGGVVLTGAAFAVAFAVARDRAPSGPAGCESRERTFAGAWTPERSAALIARTGAAELATQLDGERKDWLAELDNFCKAPTDPQLRVRLDCLLDVRDRIAAETAMLEGLPADRVRAIEALELPRAAACASKTVQPVPRPPDDRREAVAELRVALARFHELRGGEAEAADLVTRATGLGWQPLVAEIQIAAAYRALARYDYSAAREHFRDAAATAAASAMPQAEQNARMGLVEVALHSLASPQDADELDRLLADARAALSRAGSGSGGTRMLQFLAAWAAAGQGRVDEAIPLLDEARRWYLDNDVRRLAQVTSAEIDALLVRGTAHDLDQADEIGRAALAKAVASHRRDDERELRDVLDTIAFRRGDLDELHRTTAHATASGALRRVRVIGADGKPAAGARVVAWQGVLFGDRTRVDTAPAPSAAVTDATGEASLAVPEHGAVIAERGEERSPPQLAPPGDAPMVLNLDTTKGMASDAFDVHGIAATRLSAFAAYRLADGAAWVERTALAPSGAYDLDRLPSAPFVTGVTGDVGPHATRATTWPQGSAPSWQGRRFDVIVHGPRARNAHVWVLAGQHAPHDVGELRALLPRVADYVEATATPIGALDATDLARFSYHAGDMHAVFLGPTADPVTACAAADVAGAPLDCVEAHGAGHTAFTLEAP